MVSFNKILKISRALSHNLPQVVFIGGVAVYLHTRKRALSAVQPESSHDADFMISISDYGILKDEAEITSTPRLSKHQMFVDEVEFDVYVERQNSLAVPYDEVYAQSVVIDEIRLACLEHLLVLKLEAYASREHSSKGDKDRRDLVKVGLLLGQRARRSLVVPYMREDLVAGLGRVVKSTVFYELSSKNAHATKKIRTAFSSFVDTISI